MILAMLVYAIIVGAERMCLPVLFEEISFKLGLSLVSIGTIWGLDPLAGVFVALPAGMLADRFGIKRTLTVVCLLAGIISSLRGLSFNFSTLAATTFIFGFLSAMTPSIAPKVTAVWFSGRYLGLTNALLQVASSVGAMAAALTSATLLSPWLGGWQHVIFFWGAPALILGILWLITGREPGPHERQTIGQRVPLKEALRHVTRIKEVWLIGIIGATFFGANMGLNGYLPLYLREMGWSNTAADSAMTVVLATSLIGVIPMVLLANWLKSQKGIFLFSMVCMTVSLFLMPLAGGSPKYIWPLLIISGVLRSGFPALMNTLTFEIRGVGGTYGGTAIGLASTIGMAGACFSPPLGNSLAAFNAGMPFVFWGALSALGFPAFLIFRSLAFRKEKDIQG
jgi:cyanate permease